MKPFVITMLSLSILGASISFIKEFKKDEPGVSVFKLLILAGYTLALIFVCVM